MRYGVEEINNLLLNTTPDKAAAHIRRHAAHPERSLQLLAAVMEVRQTYAGPLAAGVPFMALFVRHTIRPASNKSTGLGDTIAKFTRATKIDRIAHLYTRVTGKDCGCKRRQKKLNAAFPYRR